MKTHAIAPFAAIAAALLLPITIARADLVSPGYWRPHPTPPVPTPTVSPLPTPTASPNRPSPHAAVTGFEAEPPNKAELFYAGIAVAGVAAASLAALRAIGKRA